MYFTCIYIYIYYICNICIFLSPGLTYMKAWYLYYTDTYGSSEHCAHIWSKSGIPICWRHLVTSIELSNQILFFRNDLFYFIPAQTCPELPSYKSTMLESDNSKAFKLTRKTFLWQTFWIAQNTIGVWWSGENKEQGIIIWLLDVRTFISYKKIKNMCFDCLDLSKVFDDKHC